MYENKVLRELQKLNLQFKEMKESFFKNFRIVGMNCAAGWENRVWMYNGYFKLAIVKKNNEDEKQLEFPGMDDYLPFKPWFDEQEKKILYAFY